MQEFLKYSFIFLSKMINALIILFNIALFIGILLYIAKYVGMQRFVIYMCVFYFIFNILKKWD